MERRGVFTRPFINEGILVTISTPEENDRIQRTLAEAMAD
jgi:histidinol-phosphate/aromatic aminotransferase/cobyric acid decarboxylase-like protein